MNNIELMLKIFGINFNETFEVLSSDNKCLGTYKIIQESDNEFKLKKYNLNSTRWFPKSDEILGLMLLHVIKGENTIRLSNVTTLDNNKPISYLCPKRCRNYPIYIKKVSRYNNYMTIEYINQDDEYKVKTLNCFENTENKKCYCLFGRSSRRLYENYSGPVILMDVPIDIQPKIKKIANKYGSIIK